MTAAVPTWISTSTTAMPKNKKSRRWLLRVVTPVAFVVTWELVARLEIVDPILLPAATDVALALIQMITSGQLMQHLLPSLSRMAAGFALGGLAGLIAGVALGSSATFRALFGGLFEMLRPIPPIALIPLTLLWFGIGSTSKIALIAFATFWPILLNTELGIREVPPNLKKAARVMEISGLTYYKKVALPAALPKILTGVRIATAIALIVVVAAEMVASPNGIGHLIINAERTFRVPEMYAGIAVISFLGFFINMFVVKLEQLATPGGQHAD